ncbi:uncharacterized protein LOC135607702 [Musa acuminata AAA Group]|uniref:uncharacterized protein LOC135607702 n=1 Tax=Musa acuminata AAA Group TaxID=214697 RepID=UPI0031D800B9
MTTVKTAKRRGPASQMPSGCSATGAFSVLPLGFWWVRLTCTEKPQRKECEGPNYKWNLLFGSGAKQQAAIIYGYMEVMARNGWVPTLEPVGYREPTKDKVVTKQRPQTLDALFADMKQQRMRLMTQQAYRGNGHQPAQKRNGLHQHRGRGRSPSGFTQQCGNFTG